MCKGFFLELIFLLLFLLLGRQPLIFSDNNPEVHQVEHLSSLFTWLVGNLKKLKRRRHKDKSSTGDSIVPKPALMQLIRKCLMLSASGNKQLMDSAFHIAQLIGDDHLMKKLNKLALLVSSNSEITNDNSSVIDSRDLIQQEESISQAGKMLELIKSHRVKRKVAKTTYGDVGISRRWVVAASWNPCPIGMLPKSVGSSGCLPILDCKDDQNKIPETSQTRENLVSNRCSEAIEPTTSDIPLLDEFAVNKRRRTVEEDCISDGEDVCSLGLGGRLVTHGSWKKFGGHKAWENNEELLTIKRATEMDIGPWSVALKC